MAQCANALSETECLTDDLKWPEFIPRSEHGFSVCWINGGHAMRLISRTGIDNTARVLFEL